ncbi:hypothetical protein UNPF46_17575 [Bradyrhizobium sp. UNPF46]|nr:hypothetical protein UNPF46_17575 [Bradyrhizobium sp. UNPF46]
MFEDLFSEFPADRLVSTFSGEAAIDECHNVLEFIDEKWEVGVNFENAIRICHHDGVVDPDTPL